MKKYQKKNGELRIIGGQWRGRKLSFPAVENLRPTPDRVRETLFNWLQMDIPNARCLDLFAGSGVLGLEALSRGAAQVVFLEQNLQASKTIETHLAVLTANETTTRAKILCTNALGHVNLSAPKGEAFDIVFLDPPYQSPLLGPCCEALETNHWLNPHAYLYIETPSQASLPPLPENWQIRKSKKAGDVAYHLAQREH